MGGVSKSERRLSRDQLKLELDKLQEQQHHKQSTSDESSVLPFSNIIGKRDNRASIPVFSGSTAHTGMLTANSGEDVDFVVGLSENLLAECRRLQSENEKKSRQLKQLELDYEKMKSDNMKLNSRFEIVSKREDLLKDTNWELEMKIHSLSQDFEKLNNDFSKNKLELEMQKGLTMEIKTELEEATLEKTGLAQEVSIIKKGYENEVKALKSHVSELNEENEELHEKLQNLSTDLECLRAERISREETTDCHSSSVSGHISISEEHCDKRSDLGDEESHSNHTINSLSLENENLRVKLENANCVISKLNDRLKVLSSKEDQVPSNTSKKDGLSENVLVFNPEHIPGKRVNIEIDNSESLVEFETPSKNLSYSLSPPKTEKSIKANNISDYDNHSYMSDLSDSSRRPLADDMSSRNEIALELEYEDIEYYAKSRDIVLVPRKEYEDMKEDSQNNLRAKEKKQFSLTEGELINKLTASGYVVKTQSDYGKIEEYANLYENPSDDYITSILSSRQKTVVDLSLLASLEYFKSLAEKPTLNFLEEKSRLLGYVVVPEKQYEEMNTVFNKSSGDWVRSLTEIETASVIKELSDKEHSTFIKWEDYNALLERVKNPELEAVERVAHKNDMKLIPIQEFNELEQHVVTPTLSLLNEKAHKLDHVLLPSHEYESMKNDLDNPSETFLSSEASKLGFKLISQAEFDRLDSLVNMPPLDHLITQLQFFEHIALPKSEYNELISLKNMPPFDFLQTKAEALGYDLVSMVEHKELMRKASEPSIEEMQEIASMTGHLVVIKEEYENFKEAFNNPTKDIITKKATEINMVVVEKTEYQNLLQKCSSKDILASVRSIGFEPVESSEFERLKNSSLSLASFDDIRTRLESMGYIAVRKERLYELYKPILDLSFSEHGEKSAEKQNVFTSTKQDFGDSEEDSKEAFLSAPELEELIASNGYSIVDMEAIKKLEVQAMNPSLEHLKECASRLQMSVVESSHLEALHLQVDKPGIEFLEKHASAYDLKLISSSDFEKMKTRVDLCEKQYLEEQAATLGFSLISSEKLADLKSIVESPPLDYLSEKASTLGQKLVSSSEYKELLENSNNSDPEKLINDAAKLNLHVLSAAEYERFTSIFKNPTLDVLSSISGKIGYAVVCMREYDSLIEKLETPSLEFLEEKAESYKKLLIDEQEWTAINKTLNSPEKTYLSSQAENIGFVLVTQEDYDDLLSYRKNSLTEAVEHSMNSNDSVLVKKSEQHDDLNKNQQCDRDATTELKTEHIKECIKQPNSNDLSVDTLKNKNAEYQIHIPLPPGKEKISEVAYVNAEEGAMKTAFTIVDNEASSQRTFSQTITKKSLLDLCSKFGLKAISEDKYKRLLSPTEKDLSKHAESIGFSIIPIDELNFLRAEVENPSEAAIIKASTQHGYKIVNANEYEALVSKANKTDSFTKLDITSMAAKVGLVAVTKEVYNTLVSSKNAPLSTTSPKSKVAASKQYFENVIKEENSDKDIILESGKSLGFVRISYDEYKKLLEKQQQRDLTKADIYNGAKAFDLTVLPSEDYRNLLKKKAIRDSFTLDDVENFALSLNMQLVPLNQDIVTNTPIASSKITSNNESFVPNSKNDNTQVPQSFFRTSRNNSSESVSSCTTEETHYYDAQQSNSRIALSDNASIASISTSSTHYTDAEDFIEDDNISVVSTIKEDDLTAEALEQRAYQLGFKLVPLQEYNSRSTRSEDSSFENISEEMVHSIASSCGVSVLPTGTYLALKHLFTDNGLELQNFSPSSGDIDLVILRREDGKIVSTENIKKIVFDYNSENDLISIDRTEWEQLTSDADEFRKIDPLSVSAAPELTEETVKQKAREFGYVPVATNDYIELIKPSNVNDIKEKAVKLGLIAISEEAYAELTKPMTKELIEMKAAENDLVVLPTAEYSLLTKPLTLSELKIKCAEQNLIPVDKETYEISMKPIDESTMKEWADRTNSVVITKLEYDHLLEIEEQVAEAVKKSEATSLITKEQLIEASHNLGFVPIPVEQFEQIKTELGRPVLTREEIVEHATSFDLVAIDLLEYNRLKRGSYLSDDDDSGEDEAEDYDNSGAYIATDSEFKKLAATAKRFGLLCIPESAFVATSNANTPDVSNVVVLPIKYYHSLLNQEVQLWSKISDEELQAEARRRGFSVSVGLKKEFEHSPLLGHKRNTSWSTRSISSDGPRKSLSEAAANAAMVEMELQTRSAVTSRSSSVKRPPSSGQTNQISPVTRSESIATGLSLPTMASLSEPSIIPALTQTMIGEYLYKYYHRLGTFANSTRHERYFWIHPYTLTLYWSTFNPVLENPGSNRTKAAAIMGVESVVDPNPYPVGLYSKSIIIKTEDRTVKITCPTRQRHNIWFNSLRYLLQRNLDGIDLYDMNNEEDHLLPGSAIYQLPGETSQAATLRLSSSRRTSNSGIKNSASKRSLRTS